MPKHLGPTLDKHLVLTQDKHLGLTLDKHLGPTLDMHLVPTLDKHLVLTLDKHLDLILDRHLLQTLDRHLLLSTGKLLPQLMRNTTLRPNEKVHCTCTKLTEMPSCRVSRLRCSSSWATSTRCSYNIQKSRRLCTAPAWWELARQFLQAMGHSTAE